MKTLLLFALVFVGAMSQLTVENHYEGSVPLPERKLEASLQCVIAVSQAQIVEIKSIDNVKDGAQNDLFRMEVALNQPLGECGAGRNSQTINHLRHEVYFTSRDNEHRTPNVANDPTSNKLTDKTFAKAIKNKDDMSATEIAAAAKAWWQGASTTAGNVKYSFKYDFNNNQMEQLTLDGFAVKNEVDASGLPYEEYRVFLMHTMWLTESNSLTRWFEWFMAIRTYTVITTDPNDPLASPPASVTPVEITAPPCPDCIMSVTHSGILQFYEERDVNQPDFPLNKPMVYLDDCNWDEVRNDLAFQSLTGGICMAVSLKDKSSLRKFKLEKLSFGYLGQDGVKRAIDHKYLYDETGKKPVVSNVMDYVRWDNNATRRHL